MSADMKKQIEIINKLKEYDSAPVDTAAVKGVLGTYGYPNNKISSLADEGFLIRLKKGLYAVPQEITGAALNKYVVSNNIYGPSYISYQSALYHYGLIPEATVATTAVTFKRSKTFSTPIGIFKYLHVPSAYYSIGFTIASDAGITYGIALKEKAVCDLIVLNRGQKLQSKKAMAAFLEENMRVATEEFEDFDINVIEACLDAGIKKSEMRFLKEIVNDYK